jgi:Arc/MetJ-type ribon-helix-helix transcriptional regulator
MPNIDPSSPDYVLVRVKLRHHVASALKEAAEAETRRTGRYVYVSNLVREALRDYLRSRSDVVISG